MNPFKEESLDEKIARIRKNNEEILRRKQIIDEDIKNAQRNNAIVNVKASWLSSNNDDDCTLYSDQLCSKKDLEPIILDSESSYPDSKSTFKDVKGRKLNSKRNNDDVAWREERKRIDDERIRRQKAASGNWRREWDADKISVKNDYDGIPSSSKNITNSNNERYRGENHDQKNYYSAEMRKDTVNNTDKVYSTNEKINGKYSNERDNWENSEKLSRESFNVKPVKSTLGDRINLHRLSKTSNSRLETDVTQMNDSKNKNSRGSGVKNCDDVKNTSNLFNYSFQKFSAQVEHDSDTVVENSRENKSNLNNYSFQKFNAQVEHDSDTVVENSREITPKSEKRVTWENNCSYNDEVEENELCEDEEIKNIVIHFKNSGNSSNAREVEIVNDSDDDIKSNISDTKSTLYFSNSNSNDDLTFKQSNLKNNLRTQNESHTFAEPIYTQMFSNSKINDYFNSFQLPTNLNERTVEKNVSIVDDSFNFETIPKDLDSISISVLNKPNCPNTMRCVNKQYKISDESKQFSGNEEMKPSNRKTVEKFVKELPKLNKRIEEESDDEWEDVTSDEWEDVSSHEGEDVSENE